MAVKIGVKLKFTGTLSLCHARSLTPKPPLSWIFRLFWCLLFCFYFHWKWFFFFNVTHVGWQRKDFGFSGSADFSTKNISCPSEQKFCTSSIGWCKKYSMPTYTFSMYLFLLILFQFSLPLVVCFISTTTVIRETVKLQLVA